MPAVTIGKNLDSYIDTLTGIFYSKASGTWGQAFSIASGPAGPRGNSLLNGTADPANTTGINGDFYLNTDSKFIFGPKRAGLWPAGQSVAPLIPNTILNGSANPSNSIGNNGDYYFNNTTFTLFGPKAIGVWPAGISLISPGLPGSGSRGQILAKADSSDFNTQWVNQYTGTAANFVKADGSYNVLLSADVVGALEFMPENIANKGVANGYTPLNSTGKVDAAFLPSYVADIITASTLSALPNPGTTGFLYITADTNFEYRWNAGTSAYIRLVASPGTTDALAEGTANLYYHNANVLSYGATVFYPLGANPSGYLTAASVTNFVPYTGATSTLNLANQQLSFTNGNIKNGAAFFQFTSGIRNGFNFIDNQGQTVISFGGSDPASDILNQVVFYNQIRLLGPNSTPMSVTADATTDILLYQNAGAGNIGFLRRASLSQFAQISSGTPLLPLSRVMADNSGNLASQAEIIHQPVKCSSLPTIPLPANTYNNGTAGVGATITAITNGALVIDGIPVATADRVLITSEAVGANNGIYTVTQPGSSSTPYILTRGSYSSVPANLIAGMTVFVQQGNLQAGYTFYQRNTANPIVIGTTNLQFQGFINTNRLFASGLVQISGGGLSAVVTTNANILSSGTGGGQNVAGYYALNTMAGQTTVNQADGLITVLFHGNGGTVDLYKGIESGAAFISANSTVTRISGVEVPWPNLTTGGTVGTFVGLYLPAGAMAGIGAAYPILSDSINASQFAGPIDFLNGSGNNSRLSTNNSILSIRAGSGGLSINNNTDVAIMSFNTGATVTTGTFTAGATIVNGVFTNNGAATIGTAANTTTTFPLTLGGYAIYTGSGYAGNFGGIVFNSNLNASNSSRRWLLTNAYNENQMAFIRSTDAVTTPTLGVFGVQNSGKVDFNINNLGNVLIGNSATVLAATSNFQIVQGTIGEGTISVTAGSGAVNGVGSQFLNTFKVGDTITANGETHTITAIAGNVNMTTDNWTSTVASQSYTLTGGTRLQVFGNGKVSLNGYTTSGIITNDAAGNIISTLTLPSSATIATAVQNPAGLNVVNQTYVNNALSSTSIVNQNTTAQTGNAWVTGTIEADNGFKTVSLTAQAQIQNSVSPTKSTLANYQYYSVIDNTVVTTLTKVGAGYLSFTNGSFTTTLQSPNTYAANTSIQLGLHSGTLAVLTDIIAVGHGGYTVSTTTTLTAAQLAPAAIICTNISTITLMLPTTASLCTQLNGQVAVSFDFFIDNSAGAASVTLAIGSGMTVLTAITGGNNLVISAGNVGLYRLYFTSSTTSVFSRIG